MDCILKMYKCPGCGFTLTELQRNQAAHDYPCPVCRNYMLSMFKRRI